MEKKKDEEEYATSVVLFAMFSKRVIKGVFVSTLFPYFYSSLSTWPHFSPKKLSIVSFHFLCMLQAPNFVMVTLAISHTVLTSGKACFVHKGCNIAYTYLFATAAKAYLPTKFTLHEKLGECFLNVIGHLQNYDT